MKYQDLNTKWEESYIKYIKDNISQKWSWNEISSNKNVSEDTIRNNPELPWVWICVSVNKNITIKFVLENLDKPWNWYDLSRHKNITLEDIFEYPHLKWDWGYVSCNPNLTLEHVLSHKEYKWSWEKLSEHKNITIDDILQHPELPWCHYWISVNPNVNTDVLSNYKNIPWEWDYLRLQYNENIPYEYKINNEGFKGLCVINHSVHDISLSIIDRFKHKVDWGSLSSNKNLTWEIVKKNLNKPWDWRHLSINIDYKHIRDNPHLPWDYDRVLYNHSLNLSDIESLIRSDVRLFSSILCASQQSKYERIYSAISRNKNISYDYIDKHKKYLDYVYLSYNNISKFKPVWIEEYRLRYIKALQIQRIWRMCSCNPEFKLAKRLIIQRYNE